MTDHEEGLIGNYVHEVQALAVRAEAGEDVRSDIDVLVGKACDHLRLVGPESNVSAFKGRLAITAEVAHSSQSVFKDTLKYAASICG